MPAPNLNSDEYYAILGCDRNADENTLKKAYRKLAVKWHPDKNPDNEVATRNFQKISEAYATLSDPKKRKIYNDYGKEGVNQSEQGGMPSGGMPPGGMHAGGVPFGFGGPGAHGGLSEADAQRIFASMFGGSDPFGGGFGGGGPGIRFQTTSMGGGGRSSSQIPSGSSPFSSGAGLEALFGGGSMRQGMGGSFGGMGPGGMPGMSPSMGGSSRARRYDAIPPGTEVSLKELVNRPELNGDRGVVKEYDPSSGRYLVEIEDSEPLKAKPSNLLQHVHVRLHDIQSQPEINGKTGTILAWNSSKERYNIYVVALGKTVSLKPANVVMETGTVARLCGLNSRPELNGQWGTIKEWVRETNKYEVQLSRDKVVRVKVENMRV